jgi:hypothetical protein
MKEKVYTFKHLRVLKFKFGSLKEKTARMRLINLELERGYIPINVKFRTIEFYSGFEKIKYDAVSCYSAYAGKKLAPKIFKSLSIDTIDGKTGDRIRFNYT